MTENTDNTGIETQCLGTDATLILHTPRVGLELDIDAEHIFRECLFCGLGDLFLDGDWEMWLNCVRTTVLREHNPVELQKQVVFKALDIQTLLDNISQSELDESLIINAWDPFSMVGNGNAGDISLDRYIGRISAAGVLSWVITNPQIQ